MALKHIALIKLSAHIPFHGTIWWVLDYRCSWIGSWFFPDMINQISLISFWIS